MSQSMPKLLLVDDEERLRGNLSKLLTTRGYEVADVGTGEEALEHIKAHAVDVVVLDIRMPGLSGIETLAEIQKLGLGIEVLLLTGHATVETAIEGMRLGAYDYLMKPYDLDYLIQKIDGAAKIRLERRERLRKAEERAMLDKLQKRWID
ncbi:MAG: response regulator [Desulfobacterales bacterium]|nr:response regulator [Desulfobacterales bacterium]